MHAALHCVCIGSRVLTLTMPPRSQPSMLGSGSVGAHPLTYSYGGSYQTRPLATSFTGSHSQTHRVLGSAANTSYPDLEAAARAVR